MKKTILINPGQSLSILLLLVFVYACNPTPNEESSNPTEEVTEIPKKVLITNTLGNTIQTRFAPPPGFERIPVENNSFGAYLRTLPLKEPNAPVYLYNGSLKGNQNVHAAVVDIDVGSKDLQQCADAIMRLRAEYLLASNKIDDIHFNLTNGFRMDYSRWRKGDRLKVSGNKTWWERKASPNDSYQTFRSYMDVIFMYAGTLSLSKELQKVPVEEMRIGDVFIQGGSPGHAVIVADMAVNPESGEKCFLLLQSYMPAQEIHVLKNPTEEQLSPWYRSGNRNSLSTPEWRFEWEDLKRW